MKEPGAAGSDKTIGVFPSDDRIDRHPASSGTALRRMPLPLTSLIGRDDDLASALSLIADESHRLITITGGPGVGKTRLGIEAVRHCTRMFPGGTMYVEASDFESPEEVGPTLLRLIVEQWLPNADTFDDLMADLDDQRRLIFLNAVDNVLEAGPNLVDLLVRMPSITVLATSRLSFGVRGEQQLPLDTIAVPQTDLVLANAMQNPSVALFVLRARSADPTFDLNSSALGDIIEICQALDGVPLAIELAAARTRLLPVRVIRAQLASILSLLSGGPRDLPERLRSMRAALAWSYDRLPPADQRLLRILGVFQGSVSVEGIREVVGRDPFTSPEERGHELETLMTLLAQGLIRSAPPLMDDARFRVPMAVRAFAMELLIAHDELDGTIDAVVWGYLERLLPAIKELRQHETTVVLDLLDREWDNLAGLLAMCQSAEHATLALPLASALQPYCVAAGHARAGFDLLSRIALSATEASDAERFRAKIALADLCLEVGEMDAAQEHCSDALALCEETGGDREVGVALNNLGVIAKKKGDMDRARDLFAESIERIRRSDGRSIRLATILGNAGEVELYEGDIPQALAYYEEALQIREEERHDRGLVASCFDMIRLAQANDETNEEIIWYRRGIEIGERQSDLVGVAMLHIGHGRVLLARGEETEGLASMLDGMHGVLASGSQRLQNEACAVGVVIAALQNNDRLAAQALGAVRRYHAGFNRLTGQLDSTLFTTYSKTLRSRLQPAVFARQVTVGGHQEAHQTIADIVAWLDEIVHARQSQQSDIDENLEPVSLTRRETQVLQLVARGAGDRVIADTLSISPRTAMTHVSNIMTKMKVHSRSAASARGIQLGLIEDPGVEFE